MSAYKKLVKKASNILENEIHNEEYLKKKSIDELKEIGKLRKIKNRGKLKKEGLIISILKSEGSNAELNSMKHVNANVNNNNNTNVNNNKNNNNNNNNNNNDVNNNTHDDDGTYDGKIRDKISDIRVLLSRLVNIVTKNDREKIKKSFMK